MSTKVSAFGRFSGLVVEEPYRKVCRAWTGYAVLWRAFGFTREQALVCSYQNATEISNIFARHGINKVP